MSAATPTFEGIPAELRDEIYYAVIKSANLCDLLNLLVALPQYYKDILSANYSVHGNNLGLVVKDFKLGAPGHDLVPHYNSFLLNSDFSLERISVEEERPLPILRIFLSSNNFMSHKRAGHKSKASRYHYYRHYIRVANFEEGSYSIPQRQTIERTTSWASNEAGNVMDPWFAERCLEKLATQNAWDSPVREFRMVCFLVSRGCLSRPDEESYVGLGRKRKHKAATLT